MFPAITPSTHTPPSLDLYVTPALQLLGKVTLFWEFSSQLTQAISPKLLYLEGAHISGPLADTLCAINDLYHQFRCWAPPTLYHCPHTPGKGGVWTWGIYLSWSQSPEQVVSFLSLFLHKKITKTSDGNMGWVCGTPCLTTM